MSIRSLEEFKISWGDQNARPKLIVRDWTLSTRTWNRSNPVFFYGIAGREIG